MTTRRREGRRAGRSSRAPTLGSSDPRWDRDARRHAHVQDLDPRTMDRDEYGRMKANEQQIEITPPEDVVSQLKKIQVGAIQNLVGTLPTNDVQVVQGDLNNNRATINQILDALRRVGIQV